MPCNNLDATILLETPPDVTYEGGLFYITDTIGSLVIRRCFRPRTFIQLVKNGQEALGALNKDLARVLPFKNS